MSSYSQALSVYDSSHFFLTRSIFLILKISYISCLGVLLIYLKRFQKILMKKDLWWNIVGASSSQIKASLQYGFHRCNFTKYLIF